jgi:hypothetical protein
MGNRSRETVEQGLACAAANPTGRRDRGCAGADCFRGLMQASSFSRLARPMRSCQTICSIALFGFSPVSIRIGMQTIIA